jgi:hypothetical protein
MRERPDAVARAYATLGLSAGCSRDQLAKQYRRLVKKWHPDLHASDPKGEAEAAIRMREINLAFGVLDEILSKSQTAPASSPRVDPAPARPMARPSGIRSNRVRMSRPSDAVMLGNFIFWIGSAGVAFLLVAQPGRGPLNITNLMAGLSLLCFAAAHFVYITWIRDR